MKDSAITITDQFCGAGGSSQGAIEAIKSKGGKITLALNHWKMAIETHNSNFPDTMHECTDISACDPRRYPSTTILLTSPECTNHSLAKGKKQIKAQLDLFDKGIIDAAAERSRATMWDVPRFAEYHKYQIIIVENVVDARKWIQFPAWIHAMQLLGYDYTCVYANSMHFHPTPQSRDRMYIVFHKKKNKAPRLNVEPKSFCQNCCKDVLSKQVWKKSTVNYGKYKQQYYFVCQNCFTKVEPYYYASYNAIDWSDIGTRIGDRNKPLSPNTITRIEYGLQKYQNPFQVVNYTPGYSKDISDALATVTTTDHNAICTPFIVNDQHSSGIDFRVKSIFDHLPTIATQNNYKIITPFIIKCEHSGVLDISRSVNEAFQTQTCRQSMGIVNHFIDSHYGQITSNHITESIGTVTTKDRHGLVSMMPKVEDCYYRMLKPIEVKAAMAFDKDYIIVGSGKDQVKQLGNAVTPPVMKWLVEQCVKSLEN